VTGRSVNRFAQRDGGRDEGMRTEVMGRVSNGCV
jgi:hypothetical protein